MRFIMTFIFPNILLAGCQVGGKQYCNITKDDSPSFTAFRQIASNNSVEAQRAILYYAQKLHSGIGYERLVAARTLFRAGNQRLKLPQQALEDLADQAIKVNNIHDETYFLAGGDSDYGTPADLKFMMEVDDVWIDLPWRETGYWPKSVSRSGEGWTYEIISLSLDGAWVHIEERSSNAYANLEKLLPPEKLLGHHEWKVAFRLTALNGQTVDVIKSYPFNLEK